MTNEELKAHAANVRGERYIAALEALQAAVRQIGDYDEMTDAQAVFITHDIRATFDALEDAATDYLNRP